MDIFTHLASWYFLKKVFLDKKSKYVLVFFIISAISPDLDIIWSFNNVWLHRILTHSLLLSPIFAVFLSFIFYIFIRKKNILSFSKLYFVSLSWISIHIFLDYLVVWWIPLFYPFSEKYYSLNLYTYVFDPLLFITIVITLILYILSLETRLNFSRKKSLFFGILFIFIIFIRFSEWFYAWKISDLNNYVAIPYTKNSYDFIFMNKYKVIEIKDGYFYIKYVDIFFREIFKTEKIKASEYQEICSQMHKWFLFEDGDLIWDVRYNDKLADSWSCFYGVRFVK